MYMGGVVIMHMGSNYIMVLEPSASHVIITAQHELKILVLFVHIILAHFLILIKLLIRVSILVAFGSRRRLTISRWNDIPP